MSKNLSFLNYLVETTTLNASKSWQEWETAFNAVLAEVQSFGLDNEAIQYFASKLAAESANHAVQVLVWGTSDECPTQDTGYRNYYYFHEAGNAWVDDNLCTEGFVNAENQEWEEEEYVQFDIVLKNSTRIALGVSDDFLSTRGARKSQADTRKAIRAELERTQASGERTLERDELLLGSLQPLRRAGLATPGLICELQVAVARLDNAGIEQALAKIKPARPNVRPLLTLLSELDDQPPVETRQGYPEEGEIVEWDGEFLSARNACRATGEATYGSVAYGVWLTLSLGGCALCSSSIIVGNFTKIQVCSNHACDFWSSIYGASAQYAQDDVDQTGEALRKAAEREEAKRRNADAFKLLQTFMEQKGGRLSFVASGSSYEIATRRTETISRYGKGEREYRHISVELTWWKDGDGEIVRVMRPHEHNLELLSATEFKVRALEGEPRQFSSFSEAEDYFKGSL